MASLYRRRYAREEIGLGTRLIGLMVLANAETVVLAQIPVAKLGGSTAHG